MPSAAVCSGHRRNAHNHQNPPPYSRNTTPDSDYPPIAQRLRAQYTHIIAKDLFLTPQENENLVWYTLLTKPYFCPVIMQCTADSPNCRHLYRLFTLTQRFKSLMNDPTWELEHVGGGTVLVDVETHMKDIHKGLEQELFHMIGKTNFFERVGLLGRTIPPPTHRHTPAPYRAPTPFPQM